MMNIKRKLVKKLKVTSLHILEDDNELFVIYKDKVLCADRNNETRINEKRVADEYETLKAAQEEECEIKRLKFKSTLDAIIDDQNSCSVEEFVQNLADEDASDILAQIE